MATRLAAAVRVRQWISGTVLAVGGALLLAGVLPAGSDVARLGVGMALVTLGALVVGIPLTVWYLQRTTRAADYEVGCPVGRVCPRCDAFNLNPRTTCRSCAADLSSVPRVDDPDYTVAS